MPIASKEFFDASSIGIDTVMGMTADGARDLSKASEEPPANSHDPSVHQLRLFVALAEELHFGRAAHRMFISQPAFSRQIRALERRLKVDLIARSTRQVELTAAGHALVAEARAAVEAMHRVRRAADVHARQVDGRLVIGSIGAEMQRPFTRAVLKELHSRHPKITYEVRSLDIASHITALTQGTVDVAFLHPPMPPEIETLQLATEPRVVCLPAHDPLTTRQSVSLADLAGHRVVDVPPECPRVWWDFWAVDPRPDGTPVRYGPVVPDVETLFHAVSHGQAISFLPAAARTYFPRPGVRYLDVSDLTPCTSALAWELKNRSLPTIAAVRRVAESVRQHLPSA
ncbi:LysR family transcriptional regulator [Streptomyces sp. NPDC056411]|uniref:LysR family transcriptional regulator n=1 Tax=Streptomyces sp. NPDC056411 TaxID=3345813 RepID=UPI0035D64978